LKAILVVKEKEIDDKTLFVCVVCGLGYLDKKTADQCEEWCKKTGTCNVDITKKAVYLPGLPSSFKERMRG
jgi:hypothetical protein